MHLKVALSQARIRKTKENYPQCKRPRSRVKRKKIRRQRANRKKKKLLPLWWNGGKCDMMSNKPEEGSKQWEENWRKLCITRMGTTAKTYARPTILDFSINFYWWQSRKAICQHNSGDTTTTSKEGCNVPKRKLLIDVAKMMWSNSWSNIFFWTFREKL